MNRLGRNETLLIRKLIQILSRSEVQVFNKYENLTSKVPNSLDFFIVMLDTYYFQSVGIIDPGTSSYSNLDEHLQAILAYIMIEDEEYSVKLLPGHTHFPAGLVSNIHIPATYYIEDEKEINKSTDS